MYGNSLQKINRTAIDHNLRSPISVIMGMVHFLKKESLTDTQKEYIDSISESTKSLVDLANNLSDVTSDLKDTINVDSKLAKFKKILLVEDSPALQFLHKKMLLELDCEVDVAKDASEVFAAIDSKYDLILMDIGLPEISGIQLTKNIRTGKTVNKYTDIFALTAFTDEKTKKECLASGINKVLYKPITFDELKATIAMKINEKLT